MEQEEGADPKAHDIRNEAFWRKLSDIFGKTMELLEETAKQWGIDLKNPDMEDEESSAAKKDAARTHVVSRAAESYAKMVDDWFKGKEDLFFFAMAAVPDVDVKIEEAVEVIRWYQFFIAAKVMRAIRGSMEERGTYSDSDGSAKVALIGIDRSIAAWGVIPRHNRFYREEVFEIIAFLDLLKQAVEETFPGAKLFIRPGLDEE
jgi:hypothetical protein